MLHGGRAADDVQLYTLTISKPKLIQETARNRIFMKICGVVYAC